jgi:hypothetical protein
VQTETKGSYKDHLWCAVCGLCCCLCLLSSSAHRHAQACTISPTPASDWPLCVIVGDDVVPMAPACRRLRPVLWLGPRSIVAACCVSVGTCAGVMLYQQLIGLAVAVQQQPQ